MPNQSVKVVKKWRNINFLEKEYKNIQKNLDRIKKDSNFAPQKGIARFRATNSPELFP